MSVPRHVTVTIVSLVIAVTAFPIGVLASHQFSDVLDSNPYHADIDALVDAGVTTGCGGGKYCPSAFVTREQMAAFMNRLGALGPGKTPVVNADLLDGLDSGAFAAAGHDHDADYLATTGKAADADLLDGHDASSFTGGINAVRGGVEVDLTTTPTMVSTLTLPVSTTHSTFFVFFTAQVVTSGGPIRCDLVRNDDAVIHSRVVGTYAPYGAFDELSLNYPVWIGDTPNVRVDCVKLEPSAAIATVQTRELQALALGSGS